MRLTNKVVVGAFLVCIICSTLAGAQHHTPNETSLEKAIIDLDVEGVRAALKAGADPNGERDPSLAFWGDRFSPIMQATQQLLAPEGRKPPMSMPQAEERVIQILDALLQAGARKKLVSESILFYPVVAESKVVTKFLLDRGANPNSLTSDKVPPLLVAIIKKYAEIEALLIQYGAKPLDQAAISQYRFVAAAGNIFSSSTAISAMRTELDKGAKVNERSLNGQTALVVAVNMGNLDAVRFLLSVGADPNLPEETDYVPDYYPLHAAATSLFSWDMKPEAAKEILHLLLKAGAHVSKQGTDGQTPLHLAARGNNLTAVKMLLEAGAKVMPRDKYGKMPLDYAQSGPVIKLLKSYGAKEQ